MEILRDCNIAFIQILCENSNVFIGYTSEWELLRGVYNIKFNYISNKKEYKALIEVIGMRRSGRRFG